MVIYGTLQQRSWETDSGDRRSKVEILADDVAPSLKWATAAITRNERPGGGDYRGGHRGDGGSRGSSGARPAGLEALESRHTGGTQQPSAASSSVDEEPF